MTQLEKALDLLRRAYPNIHGYMNVELLEEISQFLEEHETSTRTVDQAGQTVLPTNQQTASQTGDQSSEGVSYTQNPTQLPT